MRFSDAEAGSQLGTFLGNLENVSAGRWFYTHTEIYYSLCPRRSPLGKLFFWGVFLWFCQPIFSVDFPSDGNAAAGPARGLRFPLRTVRYAEYGTLSRMIA